MTPVEVAKLVALLGAAYPTYPATAETVAVYAEVLADVPWEAGQAAVRDLLLTYERWPSAATIRRRAAEMAGLTAPSPSDAWGEVTRMAHRHGRSAGVVWSHPVLAEAVRTIGWWEICTSTNQEALRAQFRRTYEELARQADEQVLREDIGWLSLKSQLELES